MRKILALAAILMISSPVQANPLTSAGKTVLSAGSKVVNEVKSASLEAVHVAKAAAHTAKDVAKGEVALLKAEFLAQFVLLPALAKEDFDAQLSR